MNDYKARAEDDLKIAEAMTYSFWQGRSLRKIINGYEFLIFLDRCGYTGVCVRPEVSELQKDYILIGKIDQLCRYDSRHANVMNDLALNHGWRIPPISVRSGYNDGLILWAGCWLAGDNHTESFEFHKFQEFDDSDFYYFTKLYDAGNFFVGPKTPSRRSSITELKFYAI
jgi:hypothetical protein